MVDIFTCDVCAVSLTILLPAEKMWKLYKKFCSVHLWHQKIKL